MLDLNLLSYFLQFCQDGSLLKASESLHLSQPSLTRSMQKLEDELGLPLFERSGNRLALNENGKTLKPYFENILLEEGSIREKAKALAEQKRSLRVGLVAPGPLFVFLDRFLATGYQVQTDILSEEEIVKRIKLGVLDLGFVNHPYTEEGLRCLPSVTEHLFVSLPETHFLAKFKGGLYFKDIDGQSFLQARSVGAWKSIKEKHLPHSKLYLQDNDILPELVSASTIPAFATDLSLRAKKEEHRIYIPLLDEDAYMQFYEIYLPKNESVLNGLNVLKK